MPKTTKKEIVKGISNDELSEAFGKCYTAILSYNPGLASVRNAAGHAKKLCLAQKLIRDGNIEEESGLSEL